MIEFTASGYIEVTRDGVILSRHRAEREAIESCSRHGPGRYVLYYPTVRVEVGGTQAGFEVRPGQSIGEISGSVSV